MSTSAFSRGNVLLLALLFVVGNRGCSCSKQQAISTRESSKDETVKTDDNDENSPPAERRADAKVASPQRPSTDSAKSESQANEVGKESHDPASSPMSTAAKSESITGEKDFRSASSATGQGGGNLQEAKQAAENAIQSAEKSAKAGNHGRAYEQALAGWQAVRAHADSNAECRQLANTLLARLKEYGEAANRKAPNVVDDSKPLITR